MDESEVRKFENEIKPLKMSEAIRIGCKLRPKQCHGEYSDADDNSCALRAAVEGMLGSLPFKMASYGQVAHMLGLHHSDSQENSRVK